MYEIPQLSRRSFIRSTTIAGIGVAVLGLAGCAPKKPAASEGAARAYTAGTYTASSQGKFGPVTIQATFSNEAIENIEVTDHEETAFISDRALTELPEAIVENQSLAVDTITGAYHQQVGLKGLGGRPGRYRRLRAPGRRQSLRPEGGAAEDRLHGHRVP